ncbi:MAG: response regulator [Candidatus Accumulibacter sp.]|jgi:two-component system response regulator DctR|nr:response regulator [Accumulibacter sp.]
MTQFAYIIDDDEAIRDSLGYLMQSRGISCQTFPSAEAFLETWDAAFTGCILLDIRMWGMSGDELFDRLIERECQLPVIFLTGHGDVSLAVSTLKKGAFDFVEKPFNDNQLADRVLEAFKLDDERRQTVVSANRRLALLTPREKQVMERILAGKMNKVIADELNVCMRTIEAHRASLFRKMGVKMAVELAQVVAAAPGKRRPEPLA